MLVYDKQCDKLKAIQCYLSFKKIQKLNDLCDKVPQLLKNQLKSRVSKARNFNLIFFYFQEPRTVYQDGEITILLGLHL